MKRISRITCLMLSALMIVMSSITVFAADSKENSLSAELATAERVSGMVSVSAPYPFEFIVSTTNENTAFISFVPDTDTEYTFYLGVKGERREIFKINRTQYMVEAGVEYSFAYSYAVGDDMIVYNGTLLVTADDAGITATPTGVVKNVTYAGDITEAVMESYFATNTRASGTVYESESNNTMATADRTYDDYDSFGTLGSSSDVDWWKVSFTMSGTANFWLGNIPSGCNYDISVYSQAGMLLGESYNSGATAELVQVDVTAGTYYYIKVDSAASSSSSQYLLRVKNIPANKVYTIKNVSNNKYMTVYQARNANNYVYTAASGSNDINNNGSRMRLVYHSSGSYFTIAPICSYNGGFRVLNVNGGLSAGNPIYLTTSNTTSTARFVFELQSDGSYIICCKSNSNLVLDINSSGNVIVNTRSSSSSQKWILTLDSVYNNKEALYSSYNWAWPLPSNYYLTSSYGHRVVNGVYDHHYGLDISAYKVEIHCPTQSTFIDSGRDDIWGCGYFVIIETNSKVYNNSTQNLKLLFQHLDDDPKNTHGSIAISGKTISKGTAIATTGNSAYPDEPGAYHLHYTVISDGSNIFYGNSYATRTYDNTENPLLFYPNISFSYSNN